jgi:hypothetical protein
MKHVPLADILAAALSSDGKTVRIGGAIFPVAAPRTIRPKRLRYFHVSAPIVDVKMPDGTVEKRVAVGTTYNVGRNASKRANRQADIRARVAARKAR